LNALLLTSTRPTFSYTTGIFRDAVWESPAQSTNGGVNCPKWAGDPVAVIPSIGGKKIFDGGAHGCRDIAHGTRQDRAMTVCQLCCRFYLGAGRLRKMCRFGICPMGLGKPICA